MAYSLVKVAPSSRRRVGESWRSGSRRSESSSACRRNVSVKPWWRPSNRAHDIVVASLDLVVRQRQDALQDRRGSGLLLVEALMPGHEQAGDHTRRVGGNADRAAAGQTSGLARSLHDRHDRTGVLHRREQGEGRLGALIEIGTGRLQAVKAPAGCRVPHEDAPVVVTKKPVRRGGDPVRPPSVAVDGPARAQASASAATSMGCWSNPGPSSSGPLPPTGVTERWPSTGLTVEQPLQEVQARARGERTFERRRRRRSSPRGGWRWRR